MTTYTGMRMAKASKDDFRVMWSLWRAQQMLEQAWATDNPEAREERCKAIILGRMNQIGGGFMRVVMGCEMLIDNCCDPSVDTLAYKPLHGAAPELLAALKGIMKWWMETPSFQDGEDDMPADLFDAARHAITNAEGCDK